MLHQEKQKDNRAPDTSRQIERIEGDVSRGSRELESRESNTKLIGPIERVELSIASNSLNAQLYELTLSLETQYSHATEYRGPKTPVHHDQIT